MSQHDSGAAGPRRARRRHAPARRGRGRVWLIAAGGVAVLGVATALLSGGSGTKGGTGSPGGGSDGPPALIQPGPSDPSDPSDPSASDDGEAGPSDAAGTGGGGGASASPERGTTPSATDGAKEPTAAPSGSGTAAPDAGQTAEATPGGDQSTKPGKGRGTSRRPR